ncbi:hypothetical protein K1719_003248 [Acacia pycnantha]|nr:hypothetical protein K1719_003248 [Acacia pycnantha]
MSSNAKERRKLAPDHLGISRKIQNRESSKVQAVTEPKAQNFLNDEVPASLQLSEKLLAIRGLSDRSSSGVPLQYIKDCFHTPEATKVSQLYHMLTKIAEGTVVLELYLNHYLIFVVLKMLL